MSIQITQISYCCQFLLWTIVTNLERGKHTSFSQTINQSKFAIRLLGQRLVDNDSGAQKTSGMRWAWVNGSILAGRAPISRAKFQGKTLETTAVMQNVRKVSIIFLSTHEIYKKNWKLIGNLLKVDKSDSFCWFTILFWDQFTDTTESNGLVVLFIKCLRQFGCDDLKVCRPAATTYVHAQTVSSQSVSDIFLREPLRNRPDLGNVKTRKALV